MYRPFQGLGRGLSWLLCLALISSCQRLTTGPITADYLMTFYSCNSLDAAARCNTSTENHFTYLAQSNDGLEWNLVPGLTPFRGSSPGIVGRNSLLYFYSADGYTRTLNKANGALSEPSLVSITRQNGSQEYFSSLRGYLNSSNQIVLFYLVGNNTGDDPEDCDIATCTQVIRSATEVGGSNGTHFVVDSGDRFSWDITNGQSGGFPAVYKELTRYVMLLSYNTSSLATWSAELSGTYVESLTGAVLSAQGSHPSGIYQSLDDEYWTFVNHDNLDGTHTLQRAKHITVQAAIGGGQWVDVATAASLGLATGYDLLDPVVLDNR